MTTAKLRLTAGRMRQHDANGDVLVTFGYPTLVALKREQSEQ
jgi:hypothetical protein